MGMQFRCSCGQKLKTPDQAAGKLGRCPKCGHWLKIPDRCSFDVTEETAKMAPVKGSMAELRLPGQAPATGSKGRVAVADSHEGCRKSLMAMLREHGYVVLEAQDGPTAIRMIRMTEPDAAIVDMKLDTDTGFHVVQTIRDCSRTTNKAVCEMPILMTAAAVNGRDVQYAIHLGASGYFVKPVAPSELCPKLEKAIRAYRRV
jgi:CheY-like chemotaxis protein